MLEVALARRMCCSRVCSVSTKPRRPSTSRGFPGDAPGHPPQELLARGEEAEGGSAEVQAVAERLALPDGDVDAALPGRGEDAERERIDLGDHHGRAADRADAPAEYLAADLAAALSAAASSTAP